MIFSCVNSTVQFSNSINKGIPWTRRFRQFSHQLLLISTISANATFQYTRGSRNQMNYIQSVAIARTYIFLIDARYLLFPMRAGKSATISYTSIPRDDRQDSIRLRTHYTWQIYKCKPNNSATRKRIMATLDRCRPAIAGIRQTVVYV